MLKKADFFSDVYDVVRLIPKGRVTSYGAIAAYLGSKQSSRMVGWAMNASHKMSDVPSHRVVNRIGMLTGKNHFGNAMEMQELLEKEGIVIQEDKILNFKHFFWDPSLDLKIP